jgi:hypothetical protein
VINDVCHIKVASLLHELSSVTTVAGPAYADAVQCVDPVITGSAQYSLLDLLKD